jgi:ribosomal protein L25 (general stress protein Ctc)
LEELGKIMKLEVSGKERKVLVKQICMETFEVQCYFTLNLNHDAIGN